jgi:protein transport protein YIF1
MSYNPSPRPCKLNFFCILSENRKIFRFLIFWKLSLKKFIYFFVTAGPSRKVKRVSDINALGGTSPAPQFLSPNPQQDYAATNMQQQFPNSNMQSPNQNYYSPQAPTNYGMPSNNFNNQYPQQPQQQHQHQHQQQHQQQPQDFNNQNVGGFSQQFGMFQQPMVQDMAFQYGQKLADQGKELVNKEIEKYVSVSKLKYYFAVDNRYVMTKLRLLFFPFSHRDWSLKYDQDNPVQPRFDVNAPDLYIPVMGFITYVVLAGFMLGMQDRFSPEQLGIQASSALAYNIFELIIYTITLYITNIQTTLKTLDLVAFSGYKYASIVAIMCVCVFFSSTGYWFALFYCGAALAFFLVKYKFDINTEINN